PMQYPFRERLRLLRVQPSFDSSQRLSRPPIGVFIQSNGRLQYTQALDFLAARNAFRYVPFHPGTLRPLQRAIDQPGEKLVRFAALGMIERKQSHHHSPSSAINTAFSLRRALNILVFTVSTGQPTISAISLYAQPW